MQLVFLFLYVRAHFLLNLCQFLDFNCFVMYSLDILICLCSVRLKLDANKFRVASQSILIIFTASSVIKLILLDNV